MIVMEIGCLHESTAAFRLLDVLGLIRGERAAATRSIVRCC